MPYNSTTVRITYNTDAMQFHTSDEYQAFLQAVGYMVVYAMRNTDDVHDALAALSIDSAREIVGAYYHNPDMAQVERVVQTAQDASRTAARPFVMGAVPHHEGDNPDVVTRYSYHS